MKNILKTIPQKIASVDRTILWIVLCLLGLGIVQVYSSSYVLAVDKYSDGLFYVKKQMLFTLIGLSAMFTMICIRTDVLMRLGYWGYFACLAALAVTLIPSIGVEAGGAHRWINLPFGFRFEPSELVKIFLLFAVSRWLIEVQEGKIFSEANLVKLLLTAAPFAIFILQPDFGSFLLLGWILLILFFCFFRPVWPVIAASMVMTIAAVALIYTEPYRLKRLQAYLDPWNDPKGAGFQIIQSLLSFRSGGWFGRGLGEGQGKLYFLPEAHTDFTLAVLGEEWGFLGFLVIMTLIASLLFTGLKVVLRQEKMQYRILGFGLVSLFAYSVFLNCAVVLGLIPTKGLTLPFMSYGGSSLLATCILFGIILNLSLSSKEGTSGKVKANVD